MSIKFIEHALMVEKRKDTEEKDFIPVLYLPKDLHKKPYQIAVLESAVNFFKQSTEKTYSLKPGEVGQTTLGVSQNMWVGVITIADLMQYLIESSSWRYGQMTPYDSAELERRLKLAIRMLQEDK